MRLAIDGHSYDFTAMKDFRARFQLPPAFGVSLFAPKDYSGLGSIENAGDALQSVRQQMLAAIPARTPPEGWTAFVFSLQRFFRAQLYAINPQVGLRDTEIDYAVTGLGDFLRAFLFAYGQAKMRLKPAPDFHSIYTRWLESSIRLSRPIYTYEHNGTTWRLQTISNLYGRIGLIVHTPDATYYVYDTALACPATGYMAALLGTLATAISDVLQREERTETNHATPT